MANTEVGSAYVSIIPSMKGFNSSLVSGISKAAAVGGAAVASAFSAITAQATQAYSDFQQLTGGVETMFGSASSTVVANAKSAYATMGISANEYMDQTMKFSAALKQSLGGDVVKAADYANTALQDMADNASIFGTDITDIQNAYQGFAKQNYTMLDNLRLGYGGTKSEMERLIADANEYEKAQGRAGDLTIDSFADVVQAIHDVQEAQGIAGNQAEEIGHTVQGSMMMAQAAWQNWLTAVGSGEGVQEATDQLLESFGTFAKNLIPVLTTVIDSLVEALPEAVSGALATLGDIASEIGPSVASALAEAINGAMSALGIDLPPVNADQITAAFETAWEVISTVATGIHDALGNISAGFQMVTGSTEFQEVWSELQAIIQPFYENVLVPLGDFLSGPLATALGVIVGIIGESLIATITALMELLTGISIIIQSVVGFFTGAAQGIQAAWSGITGFFTGIWTSITTGFSTACTQVGGFFSGASAAVQTAWSGITAFFSGIWTAISTGFSVACSAIGSAFSTAAAGINAAASGVGSFVGGIWNGIKSAASTAINGVKSVFSGGMENVKSVVSGAIDKVKGFFNFKVSFPKIKLPHFSVSGSSNPIDWLSKGIPKFSVKWYAKGGLFGAGNEQIIGVGDNSRYDEVVAPLSPQVLSGIGKGIVDQMGGVSNAHVNNVYFDGLRVNDDAAVNECIENFVIDMTRLGVMVNG